MSLGRSHSRSFLFLVFRHDDLKEMLDSNKDSLKLEAMKRIVAVSFAFLVSKTSVLLHTIATPVMSRVIQSCVGKSVVNFNGPIGHIPAPFRRCQVLFYSRNNGTSINQTPHTTEFKSRRFTLKCSCCVCICVIM